MNSDNIVMWGTRLSIVDWVYSKTQILLTDFEDSKSTSGGIYCIFGNLNIRPHQLDVQETNIRIRQFHRIGYHFVGFWVANGWITCF